MRGARCQNIENCGFPLCECDRLFQLIGKPIQIEVSESPPVHTDHSKALLRQSIERKIQHELAAVQVLQAEYERYCEEERAADRMPKEIDEWQRERLKESFFTA